MMRRNADDRIRALERSAASDPEALARLWSEYKRTGHLEKILELRNKAGGPLVSRYDLIFCALPYVVYYSGDETLGPSTIHDADARKLASLWLYETYKPRIVHLGPDALNFEQLLEVAADFDGPDSVMYEFYMFVGDYEIDGPQFPYALGIDLYREARCVDVVEGAFIELLRLYTLHYPKQFTQTDYEICVKALASPYGQLTEEFLEELAHEKYVDQILHTLDGGNLARSIRDLVRTYIEDKYENGKLDTIRLLHRISTGNENQYAETTSAGRALFTSRVYLYRATIKACMDRILGKA